MASSRLEKVGTIYSRVRGLLRSGALKEEDKPIWYDVYTAFPPKYEPKYDRPPPDVPLRNIFYPEDTIRAKFHKEHKSLPAVNLSDQKIQTQTQKFISAYNKLREGEVPEENLYRAAADLMNAAADAPKAERNSLASSFQEAGMDTGVNIKDIFKD
jgi:small subunit ribosomal protein S23